MASVVDAFNEALNENFAFAKFIVYAIPVYFIAKWFMIGKIHLVTYYGGMLSLFFLALLTLGINNVRLNKQAVLSVNPLKLAIVLIKTLAVLVPNCIIFGVIGYFLTTKIIIPVELPHVQLIFSIIVWTIVGAIILTSYLSFAKYLRVIQGFNYKLIFQSFVDILISFIFFIPQLALANIVLVGPVAYLFFFFHVPFSHWGFVAYCSIAFVVNISILANYFAQTSFDNIKGNNEEYDENVQMTSIIDSVSERMS